MFLALENDADGLFKSMGHSWCQAGKKLIIDYTRAKNMIDFCYNTDVYTLLSLFVDVSLDLQRKFLDIYHHIKECGFYVI